MKTVPDIIKALGGATAIANATGIPLTTVHSWKRVGFVPEWRRARLVELAEARGKKLSLSDFPVERPSEARNAA